MLWAAVCLCYFGCTRAGEITAPERGVSTRGPLHIPGRSVGQGQETQEDQGDHQGVQDGPIQGRGGHPFGMDRPKAMPGGCDVGIPGEEKGKAWSHLQV